MGSTDIPATARAAGERCPPRRGDFMSPNGWPSAGAVTLKYWEVTQVTEDTIDRLLNAMPKIADSSTSSNPRQYRNKRSKRSCGHSGLRKLLGPPGRKEVEDRLLK